MSNETREQFDDFRDYMRYAIRADDSNLLAEYPAPELATTGAATFGKCSKPANTLASYNGERASQSKQFLTELQNDMATAIAQTASVQWNGKAPEKLTYVQIPRRVWRDMDDLEDLPELFWESGQMEFEFPKGFENGQLAMRGKVLFFDVRFQRELSTIVDTKPTSGSRKSQFDWLTFEAEAKRLIEDEGGFQPGWSQANCESQMATWCQNNFPKQPSEASIRTHVKNAEKQYLAEYRG